MPDDLRKHYDMLVKAIADGRVVPFLGAGVNLCGRRRDVEWRPGRTRHLPSGGELARHLAEDFGYPEGETHDLARVSQYAAVMTGTGPLYEKLHELFDADCPPNMLHTFLAGLPAALRDKGYPRTADPLRQQLLIVTTNCDDLLERAFQAEGQPFHLVSYLAEGEWRGKFLHSPPAARRA